MLGDDLASRPSRHPRSRILRLRGLPYRAVEEDISQFFASLAVARLYICRRNGASPSNQHVPVRNAGESHFDPQVELRERPTSSFRTQLKPARPYESRIDNTWATDTSSKATAEPIS